MGPIHEALGRLVDDLTDLGFRFALIGGLAVSARTEPRFTRDVDLAVAVDGDSQAEGLIRSLLVRGYRVFATVEQDAVGRLATVRLYPPKADLEPVPLDLLFASSGIEPEIVDGADEIELYEGYRLPVARVGHLIAIKILARAAARPQDEMDLRQLAAAASETEIDVARRSLHMIVDRGFHRKKDLADEARSLLNGRLRAD